jgi:hypothetical protein
VHATRMPHVEPTPGRTQRLFRYTTKELRNIATLYASSNEVAKHRPSQGSREATLSSSKETPSDVAVHNAKEGARQEEVQVVSPRGHNHDRS